MSEKNLEYYLQLPYTIQLKQDPFGGYFVKIEELKGCMSQGETPEEAIHNIKEAMELWIESAITHKIPIPEPEEYSGKFVLRIPKSLHRKLAQQAKLEKSSLNMYATYLLSEQNSIVSMKIDTKNQHEELKEWMNDFLLLGIQSEEYSEQLTVSYQGEKNQWQ